MAGEKVPRQPRKAHKEIGYDEKLRVLDDELMSFYQYCQQAGFTPQEMEVICAPLVDSVRAAKIKKVIKTAFVIASAVGFLCLMAHMANISMHFAAVGRLLMIKVLPFWDWTSIFYESCLVANPFFGIHSFSEENCVACESLEHIDRLSDVSYERILDNYLSRDAPLIVVDAMESWPIMNTDEFYFDNITQIYLEDDKLVDTVPCILTSNLRTGSSDLHTFLKRIRNPSVEKWFVHWQNCDIHAVKALRRMYQRPYFLSNSVSPAHFNWVLISSDYNTSNYKKEVTHIELPDPHLSHQTHIWYITKLAVAEIRRHLSGKRNYFVDDYFPVEPDSGLIMLAQLRGSTSFRLTPHKTCNASCYQLTGSLHEGEMLVFTNFIWSFEYYPGRNTDNVAILTETVWGENSL